MNFMKVTLSSESAKRATLKIMVFSQFVKWHNWHITMTPESTIKYYTTEKWF